MTYKYKQGLKIELEDGTTIRINKLQKGLYQVSGFYGSNYPNKMLDMFFSPRYTSLKGVKNYLEKNFDIELEI